MIFVAARPLGVSLLAPVAVRAFTRASRSPMLE